MHFSPYVDAYLQNGGGDKVYLATDSSNVVERVQKEWPHVTIVVQGGIVRSAVFKPVFRQGSHNRTNTEVLAEYPGHESVSIYDSWVQRCV
jgi:hypothetical protein